MLKLETNSRRPPPAVYTGVFRHCPIVAVGDGEIPEIYE